MSTLTLMELGSDADRLLFMNRLRSMFNIDGYLLPELSQDEQREFVREPIKYLINRADKPQALAIWRELEKRQKYNE